MAMSDFDIYLPSAGTCAYCKLEVNSAYYTGTHCKPCNNILRLTEFQRMAQNFVMPGLVFLLFSIFVSGLRQFNWFVLAIAFGPTFIIMAIQVRFIYFGIDNNHAINHMIKIYSILRDNKYYYKALETARINEDTLKEADKLSISSHLVENVLLQGKVNPSNFFEDWAGVFKMTPQEFAAFLIKETNVIEGVSAIGGTGLLPDIWPYVADDKTKSEMLDIIANSCKQIENLNEIEKHYFLEDLYLIEDDVIELIKENPKWQIIQDTLASFEPDVPPKPGMSGFLAATQQQAIEQQRQQQALEEAKKRKNSG